MLTYLLFRLGGWLVPRTPVRLSYWLAERAAAIAYWLAAPARRIVAANVRHVLGPQCSDVRVHQVAKGVFRNSAKNTVDMLRLPGLSLAEVEGLVTVHGWEHVEQARGRGKGIVFTSAHFGELDVAVQIVASRGLRPVILHERLEPQRLYDYVAGLRSRMGINFVPIGNTSVLKLAFRTLKQNGLVGVVADRDVTDSGRLVRFFGAPARLPDGHVTLALRTGAAILMGFSLRRDDNSFEVFVEPPIVLEPTGNTERDVELGMQRVIAVLERYIGANPEQWVYFQPVWVDGVGA